MLRIAQIGSTEQLKLDPENLPSIFLDEEIVVDFFVDSMALTNEKKNIFHGSELETRHKAKPYTALLLSSKEFSRKLGDMSVGMYALLQLTVSFSSQYGIPVYYSTDFENRARRSFQQEVESLRRRCENLEDELERLENSNRSLKEQNQLLQTLRTNTEYSYEVISNAFFWKITKPMRVIADLLKRLIKKIPPLYKLAKGLRYWKRHGTKAFFRKLRARKLAKASGRKRVSRATLEKQRSTRFPKNIKISILVPLFNTPIPFLKEMIDSVINQTYSNWELCLADGSDAQHTNVEQRVRAYAEKDPRIVYKRLEQNLGISENTNACIDMATGEYIALFDHDDILHPSALFEVMHAICEQQADFIYTDEATFESPHSNKIVLNHYKPDYAIDNLRAVNYICHLSVFSRALLDKVGRFRSAFDGSQDHDMILRLTEQAERVVHIPQILYYWRSHPQSVAQSIGSKSYAVEAGKRAVLESLERHGIKAEIESSRALPTMYRLRYELTTEGKVSIIIPNKNHLSDLKTCIQSILKRTTYKNYEIIIVDNGSTEERLFNYYETLREEPNIQVLSLDIPFNYSTLNNFAVSHATGEYYLLLNNDIEILTPDWLQEMLMYAQRPDVGAVGAMLYYPDDTVQHAGVCLGVGGVACHSFCRYDKKDFGYMGRLCFAQNVSAVTAACMMVKASVWHEVEGLDESFKVAFNDVDLCMKIRKAGYLIVWTPHAEAYHYESKSRGLEDTPEKRARFLDETIRFQSKWRRELNAGDPYYNPNLSLEPAFMFQEKDPSED